MNFPETTTQKFDRRTIETRWLINTQDNGTKQYAYLSTFQTTKGYGTEKIYISSLDRTYVSHRDGAAISRTSITGPGGRVLDWPCPRYNRRDLHAYHEQAKRNLAGLMNLPRVQECFATNITDWN
jgi:hypothetical protein